MQRHTSGQLPSRWSKVRVRPITPLGAKPGRARGGALGPEINNSKTHFIPEGAVENQMALGKAEKFTIAVPDEVLADLRERLARTRLPGEVANSGWTYGTNLAYLKELLEYW